MVVRPAVRGDRGALQLMRATDWRAPHHPTPYRALPGWWEHRAQQLIRGLRPPLPAGQELLVDEADGHLRGAVHAEILPDGDVEVRAMAVSLPVRATGVGSALLARHGFGFAEGRAQGWPTVRRCLGQDPRPTGPDDGRTAMARTARVVRLGPALLSVVALTLVLGGCAHDASAPTAPPTAADAPRTAEPVASGAPVLRVEDVGGLTTASASPARVPVVSVYADGQVVALVADPAADGPPPALPPLVQHAVGADGVARLVELALDAGVGTDTDVGRPDLADATSTLFSVVVDGESRSTEVYALREAAPPSDPAWSGGLGGGNGFDDGLTETQRAERARLLDLRAALTDLEATLGSQAAGPASPYRPAALAVLAEPLATTRDGDGGDPLPWPGPALPGATVGAVVGTTQTSCVLADGAALGPALDAAATADAKRPWSWEGARWALAFRPLLPDEAGCADVIGPGAA